MQALQRLGEECKEGNVEHLIGSILRGSDVGQLENLSYLIQDLMGDVKIELLIRRRLLELDPSSLISQGLYGVALQRAGQLTEAERILRDVHSNVRHGSNEICWSSIHSLALLLRDQGKLDEAEPLMREALGGMRRQLGNSHPDTLISINNLAVLIRDQGRLAEAEPLMREVLAELRNQLGNSRPNTLASINNLAVLLRDQGKLDEAEPLMRESLDGNRHQLGNSHRDTLISIDNLARLHQAQGRLTEAEPLMREALHGRNHHWAPLILTLWHRLTISLCYSEINASWMRQNPCESHLVRGGSNWATLTLTL